MQRHIRRYALAGALLLGTGSAAYAADLGTNAGTSVANEASVDYTVGGINQTDRPSNIDSFVVDRKIDLTVVTAQSAYTDVTPGSTDRVLSYTVTNKTNDTLDILLTETLQATDPRGGTDNFDAGNRRIRVDGNGNGTYEAASDTATFIDELAEDASIAVFILADIALSQVDGDISAHNLVAQAAVGGGAGSQGAAHTQTAGAETQASVDNVFNDAAGSDSSDTTRNGRHSDDESYRVRSAALTVAKSSRVISDPVNGATNPKRIPGATLEYCILVTNTGSTAATGVAITDSIAGDPVTYAAGSMLVDSSSCTATDGSTRTDAGDGDGSDFGVTAADTVTSNKASVSASGGTFRLQFRVTVN